MNRSQKDGFLVVGKPLGNLSDRGGFPCSVDTGHHDDERVVTVDVQFALSRLKHAGNDGDQFFPDSFAGFQPFELDGIPKGGNDLL